MHVDWNWIKQRPHFIVEGLARLGHEVHVFYPYARNRGVLVNNSNYDSRNITLKPYYRAPYKFRNSRLFKFISSGVTKFQLPKENYDAIFLTYPEQVELIPSGFKGQIIYDCMDDHSAFDGVNKEQLISLEKQIISQSDHILVSSENLLNKVSNYTSENKDKFVLVRNGLGDQLEISSVKEPKIFNNKVVYLGTVSEWVDFELLKEVLEEVEDVTVDFIGPVTVDTPSHPRIRFLGTVDSSEIEQALEPYGTFIMPFIVNELIKSVDPVKFYEYIYLGGNIISCHYPEIDRFSKFVDFYTDHDSLKELLERSKGTSVRSIGERREFLEKNTWLERVKQVQQVLEIGNE